jgi:hypothetical protein
MHECLYCVRLICVCVVLCVGRGLAMGWSPVQRVLPTEKRPRSNKRAVEPKNVLISSSRDVLTELINVRRSHLSLCSLIWKYIPCMCSYTNKNLDMCICGYVYCSSFENPLQEVRYPVIYHGICILWNEFSRQ